MKASERRGLPQFTPGHLKSRQQKSRDINFSFTSVFTSNSLSCQVLVYKCIFSKSFSFAMRLLNPTLACVMTENLTQFN